MKHLRLILLICIVAYSTVSHAQQGKIAYINSQTLLESMPEAKAANDKLVAYAAQFDSLYQSMGAAYQKLVNEIQGNAGLSEVVREAKIQEAVDLENRLQKLEQDSQTKIDAKKAELFQPIIDSATATIKAVAKENGYAYVIDNSLSVLIMAPEGDDILPLVKKKMGIL